MTRALHPSLAPLLAGGGTPARLAATSGELQDRIDRLLWAPRPDLLDDDILAPLVLPPAPGDTLEAALARLTGDGSDAQGEAASAGSQAGKAAPLALPAGIAAHARALPHPPVRPANPMAAPPPGRDASPPAAAPATAEGRAAEVRAIRPQETKDREWQAEAVRLGADRPLRIAAEPPRQPVPSRDLGAIEASAATRRSGHTIAIRDPAVADPSPGPAPSWSGSEPSTPHGTTPSRIGDLASPAQNRGPAPMAAAHQPPAPAAEWGGSAASSASPWDPAPAAPDGKRMSSLPPAATIRRSVPVASGAGKRDRATPEAAPRRPAPRVVDLPPGGRVGGFAGLAALGRAAAPERTPAPTTPPTDRGPFPAPAGTGHSAPTAAAHALPDRPPPLEAQAVIAELTDILRLQVLAAGIDLSGRRS